jgi:hypothetical protein
MLSSVLDLATKISVAGTGSLHPVGLILSSVLRAGTKLAMGAYRGVHIQAPVAASCLRACVPAFPSSTAPRRAPARRLVARCDAAARRR